ncbi:MAG TPA: hypothetical protein VF628_12940 [Allosphingosinicella sp.]|jgi:hypothetical protein
MDEAGYYAMLEQGARHLAAASADATARRTHLGWANRYYRLSVEARLGQVSTEHAQAA